MQAAPLHSFLTLREFADVKGVVLESTNFRFFATDLDGTLLGDEESRKQFKTVWEQQPVEQRPYLCYNTGRLLDDVLQLVAGGRLPQPDFIISGVGTSVYETREKTLLKQFTEILEDGCYPQI